VTGYHSAEYARSLAEFGEPVELPGCGGWLLERAIPAAGRHDAMSCYPLFTCADWSRLGADLDALGDRLVSVALVADPFTPLSTVELRDCFDVVRPFKEHHVVELAGPVEAGVSKHHRYYARKALRRLRVEPAADPAAHLDEWTDLYARLAARHGLGGIKAFSRGAFAAQLAVPGLVMLRALEGDVAVGAHLWLVQGGVAYSHLAAFDDAGYALGAAYALYWEALRLFGETMPDRVRWVDLGAGAGTSGDADDGLTAFKRGWTATTRTKHFCGRILDAAAYRSLAAARGALASDYFPAYRLGEF
jgi:hypothetical protein